MPFNFLFSWVGKGPTRLLGPGILLEVIDFFPEFINSKILSLKKIYKNQVGEKCFKILNF